LAEPADERALVPGDHPGYYAVNVFWDNLDVVREWIYARISGDPHTKPIEHFAERAGRTFDRAFVLNCGNGWVERDLYDTGIIRTAVGVDYDEKLVADARAAAPAGFEYHCCDVNRATLPEGPFDLVVNYAAGHHVAYVDRVFRALRERMSPDGWLLSYDYTGPHRNQYGHEQWFAIADVNACVPEPFRMDMLGYPHLPTMLLLDPTEGIHSELVQETLARYFTLDEVCLVGGAIAYPILSHNRALHDAEPSVRDDVVRRVLAADEEYLRARPSSNLFTYCAGRPRALPDGSVLDRWTAEEEARESAAAAAGGEYYERTLLQRLYLELESRRLASMRSGGHATQGGPGPVDAAALEQELAAMRSSTSWRVTAPVRRVGEWLRTWRSGRRA
jgi:SAM-dependent methyltransferase